MAWRTPGPCASPPRFTPDQLIAYTRSVVDKGGVVTWDMPNGSNGLISESFMDQLKALGKAMSGK